MFHYNALILYKSATAQRKKRYTKNIFPLLFFYFYFFRGLESLVVSCLYTGQINTLKTIFLCL